MRKNKVTGLIIRKRLYEENNAVTMRLTTEPKRRIEKDSLSFVCLLSFVDALESVPSLSSS